MLFRPASENELDTVLSLYRSVVGREYCTWDEEYPNRETAEADFQAGGLFVLEEEGEIIGAISVVPENELDGLGFWHFRKNAAEFARVVIAPAGQGRGLAGKLVEGVERALKEGGKESVHILAAKKNLQAFQTYKKAGYEVRGECRMYDIDFFACEKRL